jgi:DNA-directed RNA polymerase subunit RPC12/RpoP
MQQDDKIITFETYHDPMLAHIIRTKLEAYGIPCFIKDDNLAGLNPLYNSGISGIQVNIFERDLERCLEIVAQDDSLQLEENLEIDPETYNAVICPYCGSTNISAIEPDENRPGWLNTLYSFFASIFPFYTRKAWHCLNCKQDFE